LDKILKIQEKLADVFEQVAQSRTIALQNFPVRFPQSCAKIRAN